MGLKQSLVSEIKSYQTPPAGLHEVMMAVYLLLGYHPIQLQVVGIYANIIIIPCPISP